VLLLVTLAALLLLQGALFPPDSSSGEAPVIPSPPRQQIWYHTGYPGGVAGQPGGMSALTGPTWNVSIHGAYMGGPPAAANNHVVQVYHSALGDGTARDAHYLAAIVETVPGLIERQRPDLILYQAGMDPHDGAGISPEALALRDADVFALARSRGIPVAWVLAGGYADLDTLVRLHTGTVEMANQVLALVRPGDRIEHGGTDPYVWSADGGRIRFPAWHALIGKPRLSLPPALTDAEARERAAARDRLLRDQRLPAPETRAAYEVLLSGATHP